MAEVCSVINPALSVRGEIAFRIMESAINTECFIEFLEALIQDTTNKIFLIVNNLRAHHAHKVRDWLCGKEAQIELVFLPPYAQESNPNEYLNRDFKTARRTGPISRNTGELLEKTISFMKRIASLPGRVMAYFRHPVAA